MNRASTTHAAIVLAACLAEGHAAGAPYQTAIQVADHTLRHNFLAQQPGSTDLEISSIFVDPDGWAHISYHQYSHGIELLDAVAVVHVNPHGVVGSVTNHLRDGVVLGRTTPRLTREDAIELSGIEEGVSSAEGTSTARVVAVALGETAHLVYEVHLDVQGVVNPTMPVYYIDAGDGDVLYRYDNLQAANASGTGTSYYSGTVPFETYRVGNSGSYYLQDIDYRSDGTFDATGETSTSTTSCKVMTDVDNLWTSSTQKAASDVHFGTQQSLDYYLYTHGRDGVDGVGGPLTCKSANGSKLITSRVHFGTKYNNAFWNGSIMTYGDGDGTTFGPLVSVDVVGHELTHGVTQYSAALNYYGESGALNESFSDVFGALIEFWTYGSNVGDWLIGEDVYTPTKGGDALRYMDDPHKASNKGYTTDDDPDHYAERYTGTGDNAGVHINSGIANKAFYLLAKGGTHHKGGSMTGIGTAKAAAIWYKALTGKYLTSCSTFVGARKGTIDAANALYGTNSVESKAVSQAWGLVGVADGNTTCSSFTTWTGIQTLGD